MRRADAVAGITNRIEDIGPARKRAKIGQARFRAVDRPHPSAGNSYCAELGIGPGKPFAYILAERRWAVQFGADISAVGQAAVHAAFAEDDATVARGAVVMHQHTAIGNGHAIAPADFIQALRHRFCHRNIA